ncbi:MAG: M23 family metallopeptidase [Thermodesulfobacteriota bacterium]
MDRRLITLAVLILLPLLASCSMTRGVAKKSDHPPKPQETKLIKVVPKYEEPDGSDQDGAFHITGPGETLHHICQVYGLDFKKVARINKLRQPYTLAEGDTVFLPAEALLAEFDEPTKKIETADAKHPGKTGKRNASRTVVANAIRGKRHPSVPKLKFPVPGGVLTSPFGFRAGVFHKGLDIAASIGDDILAAADGRVVFTGSRRRFRSYGKIVLVDHGKGIYTQYAHCDKVLCKKGDKVKAGGKIARVGNSGRSTGPHLHIEVRVGNKLYNPLAYFSDSELQGMKVTKRFTNSPMGPVRARWEVPELVEE